jgi:hypothetical protein
MFRSKSVKGSHQTVLGMLSEYTEESGVSSSLPQDSFWFKRITSIGYSLDFKIQNGDSVGSMYVSILISLVAWWAEDMLLA